MRHAFVIALLLTGGCASITQPSPPGKGTAPHVARAFHDTLELGGRISVRYQRGQKEEAVHGSFAWTQTPTHTSVTLLSPLGQTMAVIDVTPQGATLRQGGQSARAASDVNALTADALGWPLPIAGLREWLQGFAMDSNGKPFVATPHDADVTTRDGWRIRYANWQTEAPSTQHRPKRIDLARFTEQVGDVAIRIVIDTWQVR